MSPDIADINREGFSVPKVGNWYARQHNHRDEYKEEYAALNRLLREYGPVGYVLDLGVGAGRTTDILRNSIARNYVGVDFSQRMIDLCREKYPGVDFRVGDARNLKFADSSFDLVFFSFNGIDYVDHAGRMSVLREVHRVLRSKRFFIFSSHNRLRKREVIWRDRPVWFMTHLPWMIPAELRHRRMRRFEVSTDEYEIRNDTGSAYRMLTYYIDAERQIEQLTSAGFDDIKVFDTTGQRIQPQSAGRDATSPWLCYFCRKR